MSGSGGKKPRRQSNQEHLGHVGKRKRRRKPKTSPLGDVYEALREENERKTLNDASVAPTDNNNNHQNHTQSTQDAGMSDQDNNDWSHGNELFKFESGTDESTLRCGITGNKLTHDSVDRAACRAVGSFIKHVSRLTSWPVLLQNQYHPALKKAIVNYGRGNYNKSGKGFQLFTMVEGSGDPTNVD